MVEIDKIILGTAQLSCTYGINNKEIKHSPSDSLNFLRYANEIGIDQIDTAPAYLNAEKIIGLQKVNKFKIITKIKKLQDPNSDLYNQINDSIKKSLVNLRTTSVEALLIHSVSDFIQSNPKTYSKILCQLKEEGLTKKVGISLYSINEIPLILKYLKPDIIQLPFNPIDQSLFLSGWHKKLRDLDIEIHIRSIFLQGLLLSKELHTYFSKWKPIFDNWKNICQIKKRSPYELSLDFCLSVPEINKIVIGLDSIYQLQDLNSYKSKKLKPKELIMTNCIDDYLINPQKWKLK